VCVGLGRLLQQIFSFVFQAKIETKALKAKRPGFTDDRYHETEYYVENGEYFLIKAKVSSTRLKITSVITRVHKSHTRLNISTSFNCEKINKLLVK
jgi:hypothetical protein